MSEIINESEVSTEGNGETQAIEGIRVLDLAQNTAGPLCAMMLGDLGADVIKVERPGGEDARHAPPLVEGNSFYYPLNGRSKRHITLDLRRTDGQAIFRRLANTSDVVVDSFRPGYLAELGLDGDALRRENPGLVTVSISGYGQTGPYKDRRAYDMIAQAQGGLINLNGFPDGPPLKVATSLSAVVTGLNAAIGALAALRFRDRTGRGQSVDISLLDSAVSQIEAELPWFSLTGNELPRSGNRRLYSSPSNIFEACDGSVYLAAASNAVWRRLCGAVGRSELAEDERFATGHSRREHVEEVDSIVQGWTSTRTVVEVVDVLQGAGVPCGPVNDMAGVCSDPQVAHRDMILDLSHPQLGSVRVPGQPIKLSATPARPGQTLFDAGHHNEEIFGEILGVDKDEMEKWYASGLI